MIGIPVLALSVMNDQLRAGKSFVINPNNDVYEYKGEFTLDSLYEALDCEMIEVVYFRSYIIMQSLYLD
jgi:hypothetical protein